MKNHILTISIDSNSILIASVPSYGNIGQMTLDCIISTLANQNKIERIGHCYSSYLYPMTGYEEFSSSWNKVLCLPIEVYKIKESNIVLIQQRSPCLPNLTEKYVQEYLEFLESFHFLHIFFLCGSTTEGLNDDILRSQRLFCFNSPSSSSSPSSSLSSNLSSSLLSLPEVLSQLFPNFTTELNNFRVNICDWPNVKSFQINSRLLDESFNLSLNIDSSLDNDDSSNLQQIKEDLISGSPLASILIHQINELQKVNNVTIFGKFCHEGNNIGDSLDLVVFIMKLFNILDLSKTKLCFPSSWNSLFGPPLDDNSIF